MTVSTKPYLVRAIYEWCLDQGLTPYIAAKVDEATRVPPGYARDGQIVLNIGPDATHELVLGNERISFQARFGGIAHSLSVPVPNVMAVYARENGHGMAFEIDEPAAIDAKLDAETEVSRLTPVGSESSSGDDSTKPPPPPRSHLKVVK
ncbi:MAG: ClpXP protease specificity-enhancing factor [Zoogloeaceae bacterium]|nr:ClpXP protease specificity-enhancing factor [Zoogloeaceae bacterium]